MSLTGGLDSRSILAWATVRPGELPCHVFGGSYRDSADVEIGRRVAAICRQPHTMIPVDGAFLSEFPALAARAVYIETVVTNSRTFDMMSPCKSKS